MNLLHLIYIHNDLDSSTIICVMEQQIESHSIPVHFRLVHNIPVYYNVMYISTY
jgi:hypothetical protein